VKRGEMRRQVRGLGVLKDQSIAEIQIAETQVKEIMPGQVANIDFMGTVGSGRVLRIDPAAENGTVKVAIQLDAPATGVQPGQRLDATIDIEVLKDVVYVGRPIWGRPNAAATLYRIEADGRHAVRVPVRFGRSSVNQIEVTGGLVPGDRVILSDMSAYARFDRVELK
jgi:HlyD family secretion protein